MRFLHPRRQMLPPVATEFAYLAGMEGIPWESTNRWEESILVIERAIDESGNLYIPWEVEGHGQLVLSTASLMERDEAYHLPLELARGTLNRIRNYAAEWSQAGMLVSENLQAKLAAARTDFVNAATIQERAQDAAEMAEASIRSGLDAMELLGHEFSQQMLRQRHERETHIPALLGAEIPTLPLTGTETEHFQATFNTATIPIRWRDLEPNPGEYSWDSIDQRVQWCLESGLRICIGPLVSLDEANLPDWIYLWEDDSDDIQATILRMVEAVVQRYQDRTHIWHSAARLNIPGVLSLSEEQRLQLAVATLSTIRRTDRNTPMTISFDQPWGEYMARELLGLSPLHFADALVRADLGLAGIGLELNLGYWPHGSLYRDLLEINRLLDRWYSLGLPLLTFLSAPSSNATDSLATLTAQPLPIASGDSPNLTSQAAFVDRLIPLLLAKHSVHGIFWNQLSDSIEHRFPNGGLFDQNRTPKPILSRLAELRQGHLR